MCGRSRGEYRSRSVAVVEVVTATRRWVGAVAGVAIVVGGTVAGSGFGSVWYRK